MHEQSREILPVAAIDDERRIQIQEEILQNIADSISNPEGMEMENALELVEYQFEATKCLGSLATKIAAQQQIYA